MEMNITKKDNLHTEFCMCPSLVTSILISTSNISKWRSFRTDAETAFMQTGQSECDFYVYLPSEYRFRNILWLLVVAAYGLVNASPKWKKQSDDAFIQLGLQPIAEIPQLFTILKEGELVLLVYKIVDDFFMTGTDTALRDFIATLNNKLTLGEVVHGPGTLRFFGMNIIQNDDYSISIHPDSKINQLEPYLI